MPIQGEESPAKIIAELQELDDLTKAEIRRHLDCMDDLVKRSIAAKRRWNAQIPFTRLPEELITYIFLLACSDGGKPLTPLRIGSICHNWRTIAWSASDLWSSVTVCLGEDHVDVQSDLLDSWLRRAKKRPLSIVVRDRSYLVDDLEPPPDVLVLVLAYSEQWRSVNLDIQKEWLGFLSKVQGKIPLLERLTIKCALQHNPEVFSVAPQLRSVAFDVAFYNSRDLGKISLPWSQLTELSITADDIQKCLHVVKRCSSLAHLALHENFTSYRRREGITISLDGTTSLLISSNAEVSSFMGIISAPHLKDVDVRSSRRNPEFFRSLCALIARSGCAQSITRFCFAGHIPSETEIVQFLSELHNLSELELDNDMLAPSFSNIFVDALHSPAPASPHSNSSSRSFLPNLVSLRYVGPITLDSHAFLNMLDARYNVGGTGDTPQLKSVAVRSYDESVKEISCLTQVKSLRAQGMKVDVDYIRDPVE